MGVANGCARPDGPAARRLVGRAPAVERLAAGAQPNEARTMAKQIR
ncbi:MAG TPA: hypothetical protein VGH63_15725 [Polyangia bacterium]